jgi:hypothetical protein
LAKNPNQELISGLAKTGHPTITLYPLFRISYINEFYDGSQPEFWQPNFVCITGVCRLHLPDLVLDKPAVWGKIGLSLIGLAILRRLLANAHWLPAKRHINIDRPEELNK